MLNWNEMSYFTWLFYVIHASTEFVCERQEQLLLVNSIYIIPWGDPNGWIFDLTTWRFDEGQNLGIILQLHGEECMAGVNCP